MWRRRKLIWAFAGLVLATGLFGWRQSCRSQSKSDSIIQLQEAGYEVHETSTRFPRIPFTSLRITVPSSGRLRIYRTVSYQPAHLEPADIPHLKRLSADVESFHCPLLKVGDEDVPVLAQMQRLESLKIDGSELTDSGAAQLSGLRHLSWIVIYAPRVTDEGFKWLANCSELSILNIGDSQITNRCIERIVHLRNVRQIRIPNTNVTSEVILHCGRFDELYSEFVNQSISGRFDTTCCVRLGGRTAICCDF